MYVEDYEFITSGIGELFERKIIIYGAKNYGKKIEKQLEDANIEISCFCDRNKDQSMITKYPIIDLVDLKQETQKTACLIIVASVRFCDEIIEELQENEIDTYVITWYGLQCGIELNIEDERFPEKFRKDMNEKRCLQLELNRYIGKQPHFLNLLHVLWNPVLVYQPGKVGSTTMYTTLVHKGIEVIDLHWIVTNTLKGTPMEDVIDRNIAYLRKKLGENRKQTLKIITLVRDPVSWSVAFFMNGFYPDRIETSTNSELKKSAEEYVMARLKNNQEFAWFDSELKELTGVDIFSHPFDKERGYAWIKTGNVEILVMKMEKMNENEKIVGEFVEWPDLKYENANIGEEKCSKYIYRELKNQFSLQADWLRSYYMSNEKFLHFYSESEMEAFCDRWGTKE